LAAEVTRHFVAVDGRQVHYARAGAGPAVALVHASPYSLRTLLPLLHGLADRHTVLAFDTPGYGASDPLPGQPDSIAAFADALVAALRALGPGPIPVYGTHTGASIAIEAAHRHPDMVSRAVLDGLGIWPDQELEDMLREYLPLYPPAWDGSHLASLWSRVRDGAEFFPFYRLGRSARRQRTPALADIHLMTMDLLHAGPHYRTGYGASFRHDATALMADPINLRVLCRTDDMLLPHLDRLPAAFPPDHVRATETGQWVDTVAACLADAPAGAVPPPPVMAARRYVGRPGAQLHVRQLGDGRGRPLVLLHDHPGASGSVLPLAARIHGRPVLALDSPGSGLSDAAPDPIDAPRRIAAAVPADADLAGFGAGGILASLVGRRHRVALIDAPPANHPAWRSAQPFNEGQCWHGGHLLAAWYRQRDTLLHTPWFDRRAETAILMQPRVDLDRLHALTVDTLDEAGPELCRALLSRDAPAGERFRAGPDLLARLHHWQGG
jgi:pimeloyl-ACP methyl ester carboxylesterase